MAVTINGTTGITTPDITSDSATIDSTTLVVDETNNRVGIGTSSPATALHVEGANGDLLTVKAASGSEFAMRVDGNEISFKADADNDEASSVMTFDVDGSEAMRIDSSANFKFNSGYGSVATAYGCRAWVNFNGTGTVAIRNSGNVSSITDHATGQYSVNFTTSMPDASYSVIGSTIGSTGNWAYTIRTNNSSLSTSSARFSTGFSNADELYDITFVNIAVFR